MKKIITLGASLLLLLMNHLWAQEVQKMPLYEVFSSSDCPNCAAANPTLNQVLGARADKYVAIKNQEGFPRVGDPYYNKENDTRLSYYFSSTAGIPSMAVNGVLYKVNNQTTYSSFTTDLFDQYAAETTPLEISSSYTQTNQKKFDVSVTLKSTAAISGKLKLFVVLCEKRTVKNVETNGETEFFHVAKKYINTNGSKGMSIDNIAANTPQNLSASFEVKGDYRLPPNGLGNLIDWGKEHSIEDFNNLEVAVFVQDSTSKKVYQSAFAKNNSAGIHNESLENNKLNIYPNPSNGITSIGFTLNKATHITFDVYNILGAYVKTLAKAEFSAGSNTVTFDTATLQKGVYFIHIYSNRNTITKKIIVN